MSTDTPHPAYAVRLQAQGQQRFLLWQEGEAARTDSFITWPGSHRLLTAASRDDLERLAARVALPVANRETVSFDIDALLRALTGLREHRACSTSTCRHLLNGWNTLDDLARSLGVALADGDARDKRRLDKAYQKVFWGNNLPSFTPDGASYRPIFVAEERRLMRRHLRALWRAVVARARGCGSPLVD